MNLVEVSTHNIGALPSGGWGREREKDDGGIGWVLMAY
jgi:hypothetical protein